MEKDKILILIGRQTLMIDEQAQLIENLRGELVNIKKLLQGSKENNGKSNQSDSIENSES